MKQIKGAFFLLNKKQEIVRISCRTENSIT